MMRKCFFVTAIVLVFGLSAVFGGTVGKLSGVITDQINGEPLVGVNVVLEGTFLGASTDLDGYYVILNVPAGTYNVAFEYVGYKSLRMENIRIVPDITKRLDVELEETALDIGEQIVVTADRPFFEQSATNTVRVLDAEEIQRVPIKGVNQVVGVNAGVVIADYARDGLEGGLDNAEINVRGGRGNETLVVVDGIPQNDAFFGNSAGGVPDAAIEQISTQLGGFSAKYGSAQSGVINIITKGGSPKYFGSVEGVSSNLTDPYNYNQFTGTVGGPLYPGMKKLSFFGSIEYVSTDDAAPRSSGLKIAPTIVDDTTAFPEINEDKLPDNEGEIIKFTAKIDGKFGNLKATLSGNGSFRDARQYTHTYAKNNSAANPRLEEDVLSGSLKLSQVFNETSFMDVIFRYRDQRYQQGDGYWYDDVLGYGDAARNLNERNVELPFGDGNRVQKDVNGVFWDFGRVFNSFYKYHIQTGGFDLNFTKQFKSHLIEFGGTAEQSLVRYYWIGPVELAREKDERTLEERYHAGLRAYWGYDIFGNEISDDNGYRTPSGDYFLEAGPKKPITAAFYFQDKIEFADFILNLGFRYDYFDPNFDRIKDVTKVLGDDGILDDGTATEENDFEEAPFEHYVSPRIGFAYPVTERTVFHAQYGIFRQQPRFFDIYDSWVNLDDLESMDGQGQNLGHLKMESTTQYEFGFKQQIGNVASLDITAYYKNIKGLVNDARLVYDFGQSTKTVIGRRNSDFGTVKGLAFSFTLRRVGPITSKIDYTLAKSEGTGSSQNSAFVAAFRNPDGRTPKAIAPLEFDQAHTFTGNIDIRAAKGEGPELGGIRPFENAGANILLSYSSGRPYTPVASVNILRGSSNYGELTQYVNSSNSQGSFRMDLKLDKKLEFGRIGVVPYVWIQNLLDKDNIINVWGSTGEPDNTGFLLTEEGEQTARGTENPEGFKSDYKALERDPENYAIPRLIRLGMRIEF